MIGLYILTSTILSAIFFKLYPESKRYKLILILTIFNTTGVVSVAIYQYSLNCQTLIGDCYANGYNYDVDFFKFALFLLINLNSLLCLGFIFKKLLISSPPNI